MDNGIKKYTNEIKGLPLWIQSMVAISTILGTIFGAWGLYIVISDKYSSFDYLISKTATSTVPINIVDVLSKANSKDTFMEQSDFLEKYRNIEIYSHGYFKNISKLDYGEKYYVYIDSSRTQLYNQRDFPVSLLRGRI